MEQFQLLIETSERAKSNTHRIDSLEQDTKTIYELAKSVEKIAINTENMQRQLQEQGSKIEALEQLPAQRWNSAVKTVITTLCSTLVGGIIGTVLALVLK